MVPIIVRIGDDVLAMAVVHLPYLRTELIDSILAVQKGTNKAKAVIKVAEE